MPSQSKGQSPSTNESYSDPDSAVSDERVALQSEEEEEEEEEQQQDNEDGRNRGQVAKKEGEEPDQQVNGEVEASSNGGRVDKGKEVETEVWRAAPLKLGFDEGERKQCAFPGCNSKAMASTSHCHPHILSDERQTLFKPCIFFIKRSENGERITCATPIPVDTMPSLCVPHKQDYDRSIVEALANFGVDISSSDNPSRLFVAIIAEFTRLIQSRRRAARDAMAHKKRLPDKRQRDEDDKD